MAKRSFWARWFERLFPSEKSKQRLPKKQDTLARRLDSAVRGHRERDLLRGAEESLRRGRRDEALRAYRAALAVFMDRGAYQKAVAVLGTLSRLQPEAPDVLEELAKVQEQLGRRAEAGRARERAADLHEARGAADRAAELRLPSRSAADAPERIHVHRSRHDPSMPDEAARPGSRASKERRRDHSSALDLGLRPSQPPDGVNGHAADERSAPPPSVSASDRPTFEEPERPRVDPDELGIPSASTDPDPLELDELALMDDELDLDGFDPEEPVARTASTALRSPVGAQASSGFLPLPPAGKEEDTEDDDVTILDPKLVQKVEEAKALAAKIAAAKAEAEKAEAARKPDVRPPTRTGGPRGLAIPGAVTIMDPRGPSALSGESSEARGDARNVGRRHGRRRGER